MVIVLKSFDDEQVDISNFLVILLGSRTLAFTTPLQSLLVSSWPSFYAALIYSSQMLILGSWSGCGLHPISSSYFRGFDHPVLS